MILYENTKQGFIRDVEKETIVDILESLFSQNHISHSEQEKNSWKNSLKYMKDILSVSSLDDDVMIYLEYNVLLMSKRVDFMLAGSNDEGKNNIVIVELKQWTECQRTGRDNIVIAYTGGKRQEVVHPSYQALCYCDWLSSFAKAIEDNEIGVHPCAVLHNYNQSKINELLCNFYSEIVDKSPIFTRANENEFINFLQNFVKHKETIDILSEIENSELVPSKALQDSVAAMINGNKVFNLIDSQEVVFERVVDLVDNLLNTNQKTVLICEGGPGTGKSVVAIKLLCEMIVNKHKSACYVTKHAEPRKVMEKNLKDDLEVRKINHQPGTIEKVKDIAQLFKGSASFQPKYGIRENQYDCIIVDEAHRLVAVRKTDQTDENHVETIIRASKVTIFFIDENQRVTVDDIGTKQLIREKAKKYCANIIEGDDYNLVSQFRCNGSDGYIGFLDSVLYNKNVDYDINPNYDIKIYKSAKKMQSALWSKNEITNKTRIVAGYCYDWVTQDYKSRKKFQRKYGISDEKFDLDYRLNYDINLLDNFHAKWNLNNTDTWAIDPQSFNEVGCIHTSQGLEFDYCGVIIGKDLVYENGKVVTKQNALASTDKTSGIRTCKDLDLADQLIRNTYRVLLSRGQKGCYIYCEDENLSMYLLKKLNKSYADEDDGLTSSQKKGIELLLSGENCFVTGEAGTGKSYLIDRFYDIIKGNKQVIKCAPTGIASAHIGGRTLHKVFKVPLVPTVKSRLDTASDITIKYLAKADVIIIDEISMCRIDMFEYVLRAIDASSALKGSNIQIVIVGDFFQLPPVVPTTEGAIIRQIYGTNEGFAFESPEWNKHNFKMIELLENVRQGSNDNSSKDDFLKYLNNVRSHRNVEETLKYFNSNVQNKRITNDEAIDLHTINLTVDAYNQEELEKIPGEMYEYNAIIDDEIPKDKYPCETTIRLKNGAKVMFLVNDSKNGKYQNGSIGIVQKCLPDGVIIKVNKTTIYLTPYEFNIAKDPNFDEINMIIDQSLYHGKFIQLPIRLAYAITVHKSQGQTFEYVNFDPKGNELERLQNGQLYVALSRIKSIDGLYLYNPIVESEWKTSQKVIDFYNSNQNDINNNQNFINTNYNLNDMIIIQDRSMTIATVIKNVRGSLKDNNISTNAENVFKYINGSLQNVEKKKAYFGCLPNVFKENVERLYEEYIDSLEN